MKLLFCGPLEDFSGYAQFSRNFLRALNAIPDVDVVARALRYDRRDGDKNFQVEPWQRELMNKPLEDIEVVIQNTTLNIEANPLPGVFNGIYFFWETDRVPPQWAQRANMFDFIMVACEANANALSRSGVTKPILILPPPFQTEVYQKEYEPLEIKGVEDNRTIFYNVCQLSAKKGVDALLRAYQAAFADVPNEVLLVLKTYINMENRDNEMEQIRSFINNVRGACRIPIQQHPPILPMVDIWDDDDIHRLHRRGDAYVCSSRGEGFCIPAFEALAHGTTLISNMAGGLAVFTNPETALIYGGTDALVYEMGHADPSLYTGVETWFEPSTAQMAQMMRNFHELRKLSLTGQLADQNKEQWDSVLVRRENGKTLTHQKFDYKNVAEKFEPHLTKMYASWKEHGRVVLEGEENGPDQSD